MLRPVRSGETLAGIDVVRVDGEHPLERGGRAVQVPGFELPSGSVFDRALKNMVFSRISSCSMMLDDDGALRRPIAVVPLMDCAPPTGHPFELRRRIDGVRSQ